VTLMFPQSNLDFSGIAPGPMLSCDPCSLGLKYDCLVKRSQALRGRNLTRDSWVDGAPMTHQASGDGNCQGPFSLPAIGHPRYASENPEAKPRHPSLASIAIHDSCHIYAREKTHETRAQSQFQEIIKRFLPTIFGEDPNIVAFFNHLSDISGNLCFFCTGIPFCSADFRSRCFHDCQRSIHAGKSSCIPSRNNYPHALSASTDIACGCQ